MGGIIVTKITEKYGHRNLSVHLKNKTEHFPAQL